jgi:hypothetical protein
MEQSTFRLELSLVKHFEVAGLLILAILLKRFAQDLTMYFEFVLQTLCEEIPNIEVRVNVIFDTLLLLSLKFLLLSFLFAFG